MHYSHMYSWKNERAHRAFIINCNRLRLSEQLSYRILVLLDPFKWSHKLTFLHCKSHTANANLNMPSAARFECTHSAGGVGAALSNAGSVGAVTSDCAPSHRQHQNQTSRSDMAAEWVTTADGHQ